MRMARDTCSGQVALVTGASKGGTGTAIALRLAAEGAKVAITARTVAGLEATRERIEAIGGECLVLPVDLADPTVGARRSPARVEDAFGPVDILVNNAAMNGYVAFDEATARDLERCLQVNLWAPWELMKAVLPGMRERGAWLDPEPDVVRRGAPARPAVPDQQARHGRVPVRRDQGGAEPAHRRGGERVPRPVASRSMA